MTSKRIEVIEKNEKEHLASLGGTKEVFPFTVKFEFVAGKPESKTFHKSAPITFGARHLVSNIHEPGIAELTALVCANVNALLGDGLDLCSLPEGDDPILGYPIAFPWISPTNQFMFQVDYAGKVPHNMKPGEKFTVAVTLIGEAKIY